MPFVRKTDSQGSQPPIDARKIFIGRTDELLFFVQNILKPEEPSHNIISIWGQGGVGKSTLLSRFIDEARSAEFKDYCLTATVDELQATPASIMEKFADQLHMQGKFEKALKHYKEALRTQQTEREMMQDTLVQRMPTFAGAAVEGVPFVGPLLGEGVKATAEHLLDRRYNVQRHKDAVLLEDPVNALTRAFVDELNQLVDIRVLLGSGKVKNRRVILFFDTFEQLAGEATPWLLDYCLQTNIKSNVVLVIAGRDPIERALPDATKRWLPYCDNETIYWIPLNNFTGDETRAYLIKRNITDPERITTIWQLSQGLPLYLSLLTSNPRGKVDPTADVVANFLHRIPEEEHIKRQLALNASLLSRTFNLDDLAAFTDLPENDRTSLFHWLVAQPFVRSQEGRYSYHDLAREFFSRHLFQHTRNEYYATRRVLAGYYRKQLEQNVLEASTMAYRCSEWSELALAFVYQLFTLPDEASHIKAIEQVLDIYHRTITEQEVEIMRMLRGLSREQPTNKLSSGARQTVRHLLEYFEADRGSQERLVAANGLVEKALRKTSYSSRLKAALYSLRGWCYYHLKEYQHALADFDRALEMDSDFMDAHDGQGWAYFKLKSYQRATVHFDRMIELDPESSWTYHSRGRVYQELGSYRRAIEDFDRALELDANYVLAYFQRGLSYLWVQDIQLAGADFIRSWEIDPTGLRYGWLAEWCGMYQERPDVSATEQLKAMAEIDPQCAVAHICQGMVLWLHGHLEEAMSEFEQTISIDPELWDPYFWRGIVCALLRQDEEAIAMIEKSLELELPPILLAPLKWFEHERPDFYQKYVVPLMACYD